MQAIYIAVLLTWVAYIAVGIARSRADESLTGDSYIVFGIALVVLTLAPWRRVLYSVVADLVILFWATLVIMAVIILGSEADGAVVAVALLAASILPALIGLRGI